MGTLFTKINPSFIHNRASLREVVNLDLNTRLNKLNSNLCKRVKNVVWVEAEIVLLKARLRLNFFRSTNLTRLLPSIKVLKKNLRK